MEICYGHPFLLQDFFQEALDTFVAHFIWAQVTLFVIIIVDVIIIAFIFY